MKKKVSIALVMVILISCLSGCGREGVSNEDYSYYTGSEEMPVSSQDSGPAQGGRLRLFMTTPDSINPLYTFNEYVMQMSRFVFDPLFEPAGEDNCINMLAESWQLSQDGMTLDIKLRDGVKFHDGTDFSAQDVAFTIDAIKNAMYRSPYAKCVSNIDSVMVSDRLNIRIIFKKYDPDFLMKLTFPVLPAHVFENWPIDGYDYSQKLIGTGAYKFDSFTKDRISLSRNDDWWYASSSEGPGHPVWINGIDFVIHENDYEMMSSFQKNVIDIALVTGTNMDYYSGRSDIFYSQYEGNRFEFVLLSTSGSDGKKMQDEKFRTVLLRYLAGCMNTNPPDTGIPAVKEVHWGWEAIGREDAIQALEQLGMVYDEAKNVLYTYRSGSKTKLTLGIKYNSLDLYRQTIAEWIRDALQEIGINAVPENSSEDDEMKAVDNGRFDIMILGSRIPVYSNLEETLDMICENLGFEGQDAVIMPLYREAEGVLYNARIRGSKEPFWKNVYNGWTEWYIVEQESGKTG